MSACPSGDQLRRFVNNELSDSEYVGVERHVTACANCQADLDALTTLDHSFVELSIAQRFQRGGEVDAGLSVLMRRLRDHPPENWTSSPEETSSDAALPFAGPYDDDAPLGWLGQYQVLRELGSGVTGRVFEAQDTRLGRRVAIKVLHPQLANQPLARARFEREARAVAAIEDEHIAKVYEVGLSFELPPFIVMEFIAGESLDARLRRDRALPAADAAEIARQIALGLEAGHRRGIVHRDVKPSNVLLDAVHRRAKLVDFGLARVEETTEPLTEDGSIAGTPAYMSPEQIQQPQDADARSDVYSLGVILYEMLAGERPFRGVMRMVLFQALNEEPISPRHLNDRIPRDLETICLKAMSKEPSRRYATASALADDLQRWSEGRPVLARPVGPLGQAWRWCRRNSKLAALNAVVAVVLLAGATDLARYARPTDQLRQDAEQSRYDAEQQKRIAKQWDSKAQRLAHLLVFDAQDALGEKPETWAQRKLLLETTLAQLSSSKPTSLDAATRQTLVIGHNRLGDLWREHNELTDAQTQYRAARALLEEAGEARSTSHRQLLAETESNLGAVALQRGDHSAAKSSFQTALREAESVSADISDHHSITVSDQTALRLSALRTQRRILSQLAACAIATNSLTELVEFQQSRLNVLDRLASLEPTHHEWQRECAVERLRMADLLWQRGRREEAIAQARRSYESLSQLPSPTDRSALLRDCVTAAGCLANFLIETAALDDARPVLEQGVAWGELLLANSVVELSDQKAQVVLQRNLAFVEFRLGQNVQADRRLEALKQTLTQLEQSGRNADLTELLEWVTAQRSELAALPRIQQERP